MSFLLSEINERAVRDPAGFVAECDDAMMKRVKNAADMIEKHMPVCPIVLLSGPSGAGKTTTAHMIEDELERRGIISYTVSMDDYFKDMDVRTAPRTPEGDTDFESPYLLDLELLNRHFRELAEGGEILIPKFDFSQQKRRTDKSRRMKLQKNEIAIFEGIHALNDMITEKNPNAFRLYISNSAETTDGGKVIMRPEWTRLVRRAVRDNNFRSADAAYTLELWENVVCGERQNITPFKDKANLKLDSSLEYEIPVMRDIALPLFEEIPDGAERFPVLMSLLPALRKYASIDLEYVSRESMIREFIGGGVYEY